MRFIKQSATMLLGTHNPGFMVEAAARNCYRSMESMVCACSGPINNLPDGRYWPVYPDGPCEACQERNWKFLTKLRDAKPRAHESIFEHPVASFYVVTNRGVLQEWARHRLQSLSVSSTRYIDSGKHGVEYIKGCTYNRDDDEGRDILTKALENAEQSYLMLRDRGYPPQEARSVLPNDLAVDMVVSANAREWRHIMRMRWNIKAHPDMIELANIIRARLVEWFPVYFEDIEIDR